MPRRPQRRAPQPGAVATREPRPTGRPPIVSDPTRVEAMLKAIAAGVPITAACEHAGISHSAHKRAMAEGEAAHDHAENGHPLTRRQEEYRAYRAAVLRARANVAVVHVSLVGKAAHGGALLKETTYRNDEGRLVTEREYAKPEWKASQFMLQTSFRDEFATRSTRSQVELSGPGGGPIELAPSEEVVLTLAERLHQVAELQRRQLPGGWDPEPDDINDAELVGDTYGGTA